MPIREIPFPPRTSLGSSASVGLALAVVALCMSVSSASAQAPAEFFRIEGHLDFNANLTGPPGANWEHVPLPLPTLCQPLGDCLLITPHGDECHELDPSPDPDGEGKYTRAWVYHTIGGQLADNLLIDPLFYPINLRTTNPAYYVPVEKSKADATDGVPGDGNVAPLDVSGYFVSGDFADTYFPSTVTTPSFLLSSLGPCFTTSDPAMTCITQDFKECAGVVAIEYLREDSCACNCRGPGGTVILPGDPNYPTGSVTAWLGGVGARLLAITDVRNTEFTRFPVQACAGAACATYDDRGPSPTGDSQVVTLQLSLVQGSDLFQDLWKTERRVECRVGCDRVTVVQVKLPCPVALPAPIPPTCEPDPYCPPCDDCPPCEGDCPPGPADNGFWQVIGAEPEVVYNQDAGTIQRRDWNWPTVALTDGPARNERWARVLPQRSQAPPASPYKYSPTGDLSKFLHVNIPPSSWPSPEDDSRYRGYSTFLLSKVDAPRDAAPCTAGIIETPTPITPDDLTDDDCLTGVPCGSGPGMSPCDMIAYGRTPLTHSPAPRRFSINNVFTTPEALWESCIGAPVNEPILTGDDPQGDWIYVDAPSETIIRCPTITGGTCVTTTDTVAPIIGAPETLHPWVMKPGAIFGRLTFKDKTLNLVDNIWTDDWILDPSRVRDPFMIHSWIRAGGDDPAADPSCENWTASPNFSEYLCSLRPDGTGPDGARLFQYRLLAPNLTFLNGMVHRNRMKLKFGKPADLASECPTSPSTFYIDGQIYLNPTIHSPASDAPMAQKEVIAAGSVARRDEQVCFAQYRVEILSLNADLSTVWYPGYRPKVRGKTALSSFPLDPDTPEGLVGTDDRFKGAFYGCVHDDSGIPARPRLAVVQLALPADWDDSKPPVYTLYPAVTLAGQEGETQVPEFDTCPVECGKCYLRRVCYGDIGPHCTILDPTPVPTTSCCGPASGFSIQACVEDCNGTEVDVTVCSDDPDVIGPTPCLDALDVVCQDALGASYCAVTDCPQVVVLPDPSNCESEPGCTPFTICLPIEPPCEKTVFQLLVTDRIVEPSCLVEGQPEPMTTTCPFSLCEKDPPVITDCANATVECGAPLPGPPTVTDACETTLTLVETQAGTCPKIITRTWTAKDQCGNTASCVQTITVRDTTPPTITCPPDLTLDCPASTDPPGTGVPTASDTCSGVTVTHSDVTTGACPKVITRTWKATDVCQNTATCVQTITLRDITPPTITCPGNVELECPADTDPPATGVATASDTCSIPAVTHSDVTTGTCPKVITRTWRATDACGNTATCVQTVKLHDTIPPTIVCPPDLTLYCPASTDPPGTGVPTVSDACSSVTVTHSDVTTGTCPTVITRTWTASDGCNTSSCVQVITVHDLNPPTITCPPDLTLDCPASTDPPGTGVATGSDTCSGVTISHSDVTTGTCPTVITRTWKATDACLNSTTCLQTITVRDITPPVITCPPDLVLECPASTDPPGTGVATGSDTCSSVTITHSDVVVVDCPGSRKVYRTWIATDACGNTASCLQAIKVEDTIAPTITCPANVTVQCPGSTDPSSTGVATGSDACSSVTITYSDSVVPHCGLTKTITRTWIATDECSHSASCVQTIEVIDTIAPTITCPPDGIVPCTLTCPPLPPPVVSDACDASPDVTCVFTIRRCCPYEIVRTCTAVDDCGNTASCQTVLRGANGCCRPQPCPCMPPT